MGNGDSLQVGPFLMRVSCVPLVTDGVPAFLSVISQRPVLSINGFAVVYVMVCLIEKAF